jgi:hypothetical protein
VTARPGPARGGQEPPPESPFEDEAVLARTTALLRRGYERYLAAQRQDQADDDEVA